ncbi:MAG: hypothetical protein NTU44_05660 [Bacteroidetes bacterium]|nr:hypothetical protein [Bacteroidota bacterium]
MKKFFPIGLIVLLFACHLPFMTADPDTHTDLHTRGAWTDEGIYTSQIRNYLIDGKFDLKENSTFIRGPLFNIIQLPFFYVFGHHRLVSRLIVLILTLLVPLLFLRLKGFEIFTFFLLLVTYTQFHIFSFSHYGLAEMICIDSIMVSLFFLLKAQTDKAPMGHRVWNLLLSSLAVFFAYSCKIQYIYLAGLLPVTLLVLALSKQKDREESMELFGFGLIFSLVLIGFYTIYYFLNKDFYNYIMARETLGRFPLRILDYPSIARFNFRYFLWVRELQPVWIALPMAVLIILWERHSRKPDKQALAIWTFSLFWLLFELHKLPMIYLPNRYLLPLFFAVGLILAQALAALYTRRDHWKWISLMLALVILGFNLPFHVMNYRQRTYDLDKLNTYMSHYQYDGAYGLGSWATASSWGTDLRTIPVWNNYFNWKDPVNTYKPTVIITEKDESESDRTYQSQGINLLKESDSVRDFRIWRYEVSVYWMKKK